MKHLFFAICLMLTSIAHAESISFFAAAGVKSPAEDIIQAFEQRTGHTVTRLFDTAGAAEQRFVAAGKQGVLITTDVRIDKAASAGGTLSGGTVRRVGDTLAGVAISKAFAKTFAEQKNASAGRMGIGSAADLKAVLLATKRIAFSDPARGATVGVHFAQVIDKLGIKAEVMAKAVIAKDGIETMKLVASGEADIGITQMSEIVQADASLVLGAFPPELELATRYNSWIAADASAAVRELAQAFASEAGRAALAKHGLRLPQ
jgi:molybdate transport system substrate-binding protein